MFRSFRWKIALWFVGLSSLVYLAASVFGSTYFHYSVSRSMDQQLKVVASQIGHAIDVSGDRPTFRDWLREVDTEPDRSIMSIQLFDPSGVLLEHYGPIGIPMLFDGETEVSHGALSMRVRRSSLRHDGKLVGYLQLQLPATKRDQLTHEFLLTMAVMAPFVLIGFGICSYTVSGIAVRPIEELVATLKRFVADAGHELNTPASIVKARAQSLGWKLGDDSRAYDDLELIAASADRMGRIVSDLMLLAEIDGYGNHSTAAPIDVGAITPEVLREFAARFEARRVRLTLAECEPATILGDRESFERILYNLLENALRFTDPEGSVTVRCRRVAQEVCLTVEDTGVGIPAECLPRIFDRFYRVDKSRSRASGGSGLGLSIVRGIAEMLAGRVHVESELGQGSRFHVSLPLHVGTGLQRKDQLGARS